jgi:hypothetical protein
MGAPVTRPSAAREAQLASEAPELRSTKHRTAHGAIADTAEDVIYVLLMPWKVLQRTMKNSAYRYTGRGFDAAILPDGRVRYREKDGPRVTVFVTQNAAGPNIAMQAPPKAAFGIYPGNPVELVYRLLGKDPFAAERRTFLARTRKLREYLARHAGQDEDEPTELPQPAKPAEPEALVEPPE